MADLCEVVEESNHPTQVTQLAIPKPREKSLVAVVSITRTSRDQLKLTQHDIPIILERVLSNEM